MFGKYYITNQFYKVSDNFIVSLISKNGCSTIALQSKCYHENLDIKEFNKTETCHLLKHYPTVFREIQSKYKVVDFNEEKSKGNKIVAIFRDPIERFKSIYFTKFASHLNRDDFHDNLIMLKNYFDKNLFIDHHYIPLTQYYKFDEIDIYIELKDYELFCKEHNIPWIMANKNIDDNYKNFVISEEDKEIIKEIYKEDFELINKIKQSNKQYIPNNE